MRSRVACDRANLRAALIRVDLHVHSSASFDCAVDPERVAAMSAAAAAVTDGAGTARVVEAIEAVVAGRLEAR